jgi:hypothetical protein
VKGNEMLFELNIQECPICKKPMMNRDKSKLFPDYRNLDQASQMKERGVVFVSKTYINGKYICVECEEANKATFHCELCGKEKPSSKICQSFGYPPDYLCIDCFETVPASEWEKAVESLADEHRWDFE